MQHNLYSENLILHLTIDWFEVNQLNKAVQPRKSNDFISINIATSLSKHMLGATS